MIERGSLNRKILPSWEIQIYGKDTDQIYYMGDEEGICHILQDSNDANVCFTGIYFRLGLTE